MLLLEAQFELAKVARRTSERKQLETVLAKQERTIRTAIGTYLQEVRSPAAIKEIRQYLEQSNTRAALDVVNQHIVALGRVIPNVIVDTGVAQAKALASKVPNTSRIAISFDPSNARAAQLMRSSQLQFVQQFTTQQADATRYALATAAQNGGTLQQTVAAFRDSIGLTTNQVQAVESYRTLLENGSAQAVDRELRDRRFDRSVERAAQDGEPLSDDQIDRMVDRYQLNMLSYRAENIARTEGLSAVSQAQYEASLQAIEQAGFDGGTVTRTWNTAGDNRVRDSHAEMDGQTVGIDEAFVTPDGEELMYPGDPAASAKERINCRCFVTMNFN